MDYSRIVCRVCSQPGGVSAAKIHRFSGPAVIIGYIFLVPSILGILFGVFVGIASVVSASSAAATATSDAGMAGASLGMTMGLFMAGFVMLVSFVGGLIGWILVMKRNVLRCRICGGLHGDLAKPV